jgi:hypothetical protein
VVGRPIQVWGVALSSGCPAKALDLLVISIEGVPPHERRRVTIFPCDPSGRAAPAEAVTIDVEPDVVALDVYETDGEPGGELLFLTRSGIRITSPWGEKPLRELSVPGGLPLPPRARRLSRMPVAGDWDATGKPMALLPSINGGELVDLESGENRRIELPVIAQYQTWDPDLPGRVRKLMVSEFHWPVLVQGDDDGDGHRDLFALSRWEISIFRNTGQGLPSKASRRIELQPFSAEEEMRFEATDITYFASDLDGDGLTDLMLHRISGGVMAGQSITDIHLNKGQGAQAPARPDAQLKVSKGFSGVEPMDLDGDGRDEIIQTSFQFGILQIVRTLLTGKTEVQVRILNADREEPGKFNTSWEQDMTFHINFDEGRVDGLFPEFKGDWNGDGLRDLLYPDGDERMGIRLGEPAATGPGFGERVASQPIPLSAGQTRVADLNGDGLQDLVAYDPRNLEGIVWAYYNRGVLPGTPARVGLARFSAAAAAR